MAPATKPRAVGRPRDAAVERRILEVTLRALSEQGYARMSVDGIAAEAGASKPTIYRRWSGKADLATAALAQLRMAEPPPATGSARGDLEAMLTNFRGSLLRPNGMALIGTVLAEESHTPELLHLFRERIVEPRRAMVRRVLEQARAQGELDADAAEIDVAVNLLIGSFYARYLTGQPVPADWARRIVKLVWRGISR